MLLELLDQLVLLVQLAYQALLLELVPPEQLDLLVLLEQLV